MQTVKDLSVEELKAVIGEVVEEKLREIVTDPDAGLTLRPEIRERLLRDLQEPQEEGQNIPAAEVARRRGLEWYRRSLQLAARLALNILFPQAIKPGSRVPFSGSH